jgi:hypothetical protein
LVWAFEEAWSRHMMSAIRVVAHVG